MDPRKVEQAVSLLLEGLGLTAEGMLAETPRRVAEAMPDLFPGLCQPRPGLEVVMGPEQLVSLRSLPFYSICEHHLLPFFGSADISYLPEGGRIAGIGAIARVLAWHAGRLQLQERLGEEVASYLFSRLRPRALVVRLTARQLCMEMRDPATRGAELVTEARLGEVGLLP